MTTARPFTPEIIRFIGLSGVLGGTMVLSLLSDFLSFMTLHIYLFYLVAAKIFNWQLTILYSLFNLFQGNFYSLLNHICYFQENHLYFVMRIFLHFPDRQKMEHSAKPN